MEIIILIAILISLLFVIYWTHETKEQVSKIRTYMQEQELKDKVEKWKEEPEKPEE